MYGDRVINVAPIYWEFFSLLINCVRLGIMKQVNERQPVRFMSVFNLICLFNLNIHLCDGIPLRMHAMRWRKSQACMRTGVPYHKGVSRVLAYHYIPPGFETLSVLGQHICFFIYCVGRRVCLHRARKLWIL